MKVISGGQTGADRAGLDAAAALGLPTGGHAPAGFWTESGADPSLERLGLAAGGSPELRTERNVLDADATVIFALRAPAAGSELTRALTLRHRKPAIVLDPWRRTPPARWSSSCVPRRRRSSTSQAIGSRSRPESTDGSGSSWPRCSRRWRLTASAPRPRHNGVTGSDREGWIPRRAETRRKELYTKRSRSTLMRVRGFWGSMPVQQRSRWQWRSRAAGCDRWGRSQSGAELLSRTELPQPACGPPPGVWPSRADDGRTQIAGTSVGCGSPRGHGRAHDGFPLHRTWSPP